MNKKKDDINITIEKISKEFTNPTLKALLQVDIFVSFLSKAAIIYFLSSLSILILFSYQFNFEKFTYVFMTQQENYKYIFYAPLFLIIFASRMKFLKQCTLSSSIKFVKINGLMKVYNNILINITTIICLITNIIIIIGVFMIFQDAIYYNKFEAINTIFSSLNIQIINGNKDMIEILHKFSKFTTFMYIWLCSI